MELEFVAYTAIYNWMYLFVQKKKEELNGDVAESLANFLADVANLESSNHSWEPMQDALSIFLDFEDVNPQDLLNQMNEKAEVLLGEVPLKLKAVFKTLMDHVVEEVC